MERPKWFDSDRDICKSEQEFDRQYSHVGVGGTRHIRSVEIKITMRKQKGKLVEWLGM